MNRLPLRGLLIATIALATTAFTLNDTAPRSEAPSIETLDLRSSHRVTIRYARRNATITLTPIRGRRSPLRGDVIEGAVYAAGRWTTFQFNKSDDGLVATARLLSFEEIKMFALRTDAGLSYTWVEEDPQARGDDEPDDDEKPEEPEPEDPPDDDEGCNMVDIRDPWTGECGDSELKDPWEDVEDAGQVVSFSI